MVGDQIPNDKKFKQKDKVIEPSEENSSLEKDDGKSYNTSDFSIPC